MKVVQLLGPAGSGKTSTALWFSRCLEEAAGERAVRLKAVHVNCKVEVKTQLSLYRTLLAKASGKDVRGFPAEEYLRLLLEHLRKEGRYLVILLDDVDYLVHRGKEEQPEGGVVYDMTRLDEIQLGEPSRVLGVVFIARDDGFWGLLDPSERSSLGQLIVRLPSYCKRELLDILEARVEEAFTPEAVPREVLEYVSDLASGKKEDPGDCRYALDILYSAGLKAEEDRAEEVSLEHVREAYSETSWGVLAEDLLTLGPHGILVLRALAQALGGGRSAYASVKAVHEYYEMICETREVHAFSYTRVRQLIKELSYLGALELEPGKGVGVAGATLSNLGQGLDALEQRMKDFRPGHPGV